MAGLGGLLTMALSAYGGYGKGRQARDQERLQKQQNDIYAQQNTEQARLDDASIQQKKLENQQTEQNRQFESTLRLPTNWGKLTPDQKMAYLQVRLSRAQQAHDFDLAASVQNEINGIGMDAQRLSTVDVNKARGGLYDAQGILARARARAASTAQATALQIARGHDAAQINKAGMEIRGRIDVAKVGVDGREAVATIAGAYRLTGINAQDAVNMATRDYLAQVQQYKAEASADVLSDNGQMPAAPVAPTFQPALAPTITYNLGPSGVPIPQFAPPNVGTDPAPPKADYLLTKYTTIADNLKKQGKTVQQITTLLDQAVTVGSITRATRDAVIKHLGKPAASAGLGWGDLNPRPKPLPVKKPGGSQAAIPFDRGVSYANPVAQADIASLDPQMQGAFAYIVAPFAPLVTSVAHGGHVAGSAHYDHRAVDVGAFGGTAVGYNAPTWNAIMYAISSGQFSRIGTIPEIVNNPAAQAFARQHGVLLFLDQGSGNHVHFQVDKT